MQVKLIGQIFNKTLITCFKYFVTMMTILCLHVFFCNTYFQFLCDYSTNMLFQNHIIAELDKAKLY